MIDLATQHELDSLNREVTRLKRYESLYQAVKEENKPLEKRVKVEQKLKSKYKTKWHQSAGINKPNKSDVTDLVFARISGFAITLRDIAVVTGTNYSTVKSINRKLTT